MAGYLGGWGEGSPQGLFLQLQVVASGGYSEPGLSLDSSLPDFQSEDQEVLIRSVERYKSQGTWPNNPALEQPEYDGLQEILIAAGLVKEHQPYSKVVRPEYAAAAIQSAKP